MEAAILLAVAPASLALAPQVSAPPPFGIFHDLRWLLVFHSTWWGFALALVGLLLFRTALVTGFVRLAWPPAVERPPLAQQALRAATFATGATLALAVPALLSFVIGATALSWLVFTTAAYVLLVAGLVHHTAVVPTAWRRLPGWRTAGWTVVAFAVLTAAAVAIVLSPTWAAVPLAVVTGAGSGWVWTRFVDRLVGLDPPPRRWPVTAVALVAVFGVGLGGVALFSPSPAPGSGPPDDRGPDRREPDRAGAAPVLVAAGYSSSYDGAVDVELGPDFVEWRYSYRGLGPDGEPLPYRSDATHADLATLARRMAEQVEALHRRTGQPVTIVASSEGSVVARTYLGLADGTDVPVERLVLLSPLIRPARVYYPPEGVQGWGLATGWGLRGLGWALSAVSSYEFDPDLPFLRSMLEHAPALRFGMECPVEGVAVQALLPLAAATVIPTEGDIEIPVAVIGGFHGAALGHLEAQGDVAAFLRTTADPGADPFGLATTVLRAAATAWHPPTLPLGLNPAWDIGPSISGPAVGESRDCRLSEAAFERWAAGVPRWADDDG